MKTAVVIHPRFTIYGGGEMVCLHVLKVLLDLNYSVTIVTDHYSPALVERNFRMGEVMARCNHLSIAPFRPALGRFLALQRLRYAEQIAALISRNLEPELAFSTQSSIYYVHNIKTFNIVYDIDDFLEVHASQYGTGRTSSVLRVAYYQLLSRIFHPDFTRNRLFIPLSRLLEQQLEEHGYKHTPVVFPPCDMIFKPKPKRKQVVQVTRVVPAKKLEDFMQIARKLPDYKFIIVGTPSDTNLDYTRRLLLGAPPNVEFVEARIRDRAELVEESKVYLYTSVESGINISLGQALGAGCIPVTPVSGGGPEMVQRSGVGYSYRNIEEAVWMVRRALESDAARDRPEYVALKAKMFSSELFRKRIRSLVE